MHERELKSGDGTLWIVSDQLCFVNFDIECPVSCKLGPVNVTKYLCPFNEITFQGGLLVQQCYFRMGQAWTWIQVQFSKLIK